jgi:hypothetical protein
MANPISGDCLERFQPAQVGIKEAEVLYPLPAALWAEGGAVDPALPLSLTLPLPAPPSIAEISALALAIMEEL